MEREHQIIQAVIDAKKSTDKADNLIRKYIPFIRSEASRCTMRVITESDDEYSIAMIAFHEAVMGYEKGRGAFLKYASMLIKSRLIDYSRKEARHKGHASLYDEYGEDEMLIDVIPDDKDEISDRQGLEATQAEIAELALVLQNYGVSFSDIADSSPKQERTLEACRRAILYATENREVLSELLRTKKLPMSALVSGSGCDRKTLERHRKYVLAMLLIQTNGFEIIRGHLRHVLKGGGK